MGRPLKLHNSPLRNLAMLRDEFAAWAARGDACFSRITVQRQPMLKDDGSLDAAGLMLLSETFGGERDLLVVGDWAEDPTDPECYHEFFWRREEGTHDLLVVFNELSESAL